MYIHGYMWYIHDGYTWISMYIPGISTPLDIHGISMDIHGYTWISQGYRSGRHIHGIYLEYSMYIHEIGVPDVLLINTLTGRLLHKYQCRAAARHGPGPATARPAGAAGRQPWARPAAALKPAT